MKYEEIINNYWMRLSMISRIIQTKVNIDRGLNNSRYHAKAESSNCFTIHFSKDITNA